MNSVWSSEGKSEKIQTIDNTVGGTEGDDSIRNGVPGPRGVKAHVEQDKLALALQRSVQQVQKSMHTDLEDHPAFVTFIHIEPHANTPCSHQLSLPR